MRRSLTLISKRGEDNLQVLQSAIPAIGDNDVLVDVKFCGLNFAEASMRQVRQMLTLVLSCQLRKLFGQFFWVQTNPIIKYLDVSRCLVDGNRTYLPIILFRLQVVLLETTFALAILLVQRVRSG